MTVLGSQLTRIATILQNTVSDIQARAILQHQEEVALLARQRFFPQITWMGVVQGQSLYTLPTNTVWISYVLYNQRVLQFTTESALDRLDAQTHWRTLRGEPSRWLVENQAPNTLQLVPIPIRSGAVGIPGGTVPPAPPLPFIQDVTDNLLIFHWEDPARGLADLDVPLPTLLDWEDRLVYATAAALASQEREDQNLPVAAACAQLEALWTQLMKKG